MPEPLTLDLFATRLGESFRLYVTDTLAFDIVLTEASLWGPEGGGAGRTPFTLLFHAPPGALVPQRIYRLENEHTDPFEVFLVPVGPDARGMRYEAVFV